MRFKTRDPSILRGALAGMALSVLLAGCGGDLFDVENPGRILDDDLNSIEAVNALVVGSSAAFSEGYDDNAFFIARGTDEMAGTGSYFSTGLWRRGVFNNEDFNGNWGDAQEARWTAEAGLLRMQEIEGYEFEGNELTAKAYLMAGFANRWLGETFCQVSYQDPYESDTGEALPKSAAFERGLGQFEEAVFHATQAGVDSLAQAATGGIAQMHADLGQWAQVTQYSEQIPTDYLYEAIYYNNTAAEINEFWNETHGRYEMSAIFTLAGDQDPPDPRAPYTDCRLSSDCTSELGADGTYPHLRQEKYDARGSNIPLVKGTEMRLLEAEAALNEGDLATAMDRINEARAHYGLDPLEATDGIGSGFTGDRDSMTGWDILDRERYFTLWLEGRRLYDLHRWDHPFLDGGTLIDAQGYIAEGRRDSCAPIAFDECQTNPNLGSDVCG